MPKNIQLINLNSSNSILVLKSKVPNIKAFNLINGFLIGLENSEFIKFSDIDLGDIETDQENESENNLYYISNITTKITTDFKDINQKYLKKLGSEGLSNRIDLLNIIDK